MSSENLQKFLAAVSSHATLQSKVGEILTSAGEGDASQALAALAAEAGLEVKAEEIRDFLGAQAGDELQPEQLAGIAGGYYPLKNPHSPFEN